MIRSKAGLSGLLLLGACARYAPAPLADRPPLLAAPTPAALARAAAAIDRPYLKAAAIDLSAPLDDTAIATIAVIANPDLKVRRARAGVAAAQAFAARLLPDPTFGIGAGPVLAGPDPFVDIASALGLDINALRTRGARVAAAKAQAEQVRLDLAWAEWQAAGQARIQAARIRGLERGIVLARAGAASAGSLLERTLRAVGRGDLAADRTPAQRLAAADAQDRLRIAERDLAAARLELAKLLGLPPATALALAPAPAPASEGAPDPDALFELARGKRADLQALRAGYAAQEATVRKAILDQFPTLALVINTNRDSAGNAISGPAIDVTLPLWNRNRGGIAVERATREALKAEYEGRLFQARAEIATASSGIAVAQRQRAAVLRDLPALRRFAGASREAAARGDLALAAAELAEQAQRDKQALLAQSEQDIAEQIIALELLTGTPKEAWPR